MGRRAITDAECAQVNVMFTLLYNFEQLRSHERFRKQGPSAVHLRVISGVERVVGAIDQPALPAVPIVAGVRHSVDEVYPWP